MPILSMFFGIVIRMFYDDHHPPHIHVEYQGNMCKGDLPLTFDKFIFHKIGLPL
jgi:hypothetical protein